MTLPAHPESFRSFAGRLILDNGKPLRLQRFQTAAVADITAGTPEIWICLPEGNGKTTLLAALVLWHARTVPFASVPVAASTRDQAMVLYRAAKHLVLRSGLQDEYSCQDGTRRIKHGTGGAIRSNTSESLIQIFAADAGGADGVVPSLAVIDEPHRQASPDLYLTWSGKLGKRAGQLVLISTAGEPGHWFETMREEIRANARDVQRRGRCFARYESPDIVLHEFAVPPDGDLADMRLVKDANPLNSITVSSLRKKRAKPTMTEGHWARFTANRPTRSVAVAINEREWLDAKGPGIPAGVEILLGADFGWVHDPTAFVPFYLAADDDRRLGVATVIDPPRDGSMIDVAEVERAIELIHQRNPVRLMVADLTNARDVAEWCERELGIEVVARTHSLPGQVEDFASFTEALRNGWISHSGDVALTRHVLNAVARPLPRGDYVFARPVASRLAKHQDLRRIDALVAAAMVHTVATANVAGSVYDDRGLLVL